MAKVPPYPTRAHALRDRARKVIRAAARITNLPSGVMANPPTITLGAAGAASTLTTGYGNAGTLTAAGVTHPMTSAGLAPLSLPLAPWSASGSGHVANAVYGASATQGHGVAFRFSGRVFEVGTLGATASSRLRLVVTDPATGLRQPASAADLVPTPGASFTKVDFGTKSDRIVEVTATRSQVFAGFNFMRTDDVRAWRWPDAPAMAVVGDSYQFGTNTASIRDNPGTIAGEVLGARSVLLNGVGGTGFVANNNGNSFTFLQRVQTGGDLNVARIGEMDLVAIVGSVNDNASTDAAVQAAVQATVAAAMSAQPNAIIVVSGPQYANAFQTPTARYAAVQAGVAAAVAAAGDTSGRVIYLDTSPAGEAWQTGSGKAPFGTVSFSAQPSANDTVTLGGTVVTFVAAAPGANQVLIGPGLADTLANLATLVNGSADANLAKVNLVPTSTNVAVIAKAGADGFGFTLAASVATVSGATLNATALAANGTNDNDGAQDGTHLTPSGNVAYGRRMAASYLKALAPLAV